jgi:thioesterase domain-containing protein
MNRSRITSAALALAAALLPISSLAAQHGTVVHRSAADTTQNAYRVVAPAGEARGLLVLLPGYGGGVESFLPESYTPSTLPARLAAEGIATVVAVPARATLYADDEPVRVLDEIIAEVVERHRVPRGAVVVGGFSAGGTGAVRYAEWCAAGRCRAVERVAGVFAVDAPLDFERMYRASTLDLARPGTRVNRQEARMIVDALRAALGGSPDEAHDAYLARSPVLASRPDGGNALALGMAKTPLRLYTEPDVAWWMENRDTDYYGMNALDAAALVNVVRMHGNPNAHLVLTTGRGVRPNGARHPHSWSIVDEDDLARWIVGLVATLANRDR